jgi:hypothetical protein
VKFKIGDKVMLKAVPYENWGEYCKDSRLKAKKFFTSYKDNIFIVISVGSVGVFLKNGMYLYIKYLKHAVKPKVVKYTIDCTGMVCQFCPRHINGKIEVCQFTGTKTQVEAHIKRYWKQPKIKAVVK